MIKIDKRFLEFPFKKIALVVSTLLLFYLLNDRIVAFVENNLLLKEHFSNLGFDIFILILTLFIIIFFCFRFSYYKYKPSFFAFYLYTIIVGATLYFLLISERIGWSFYKDSIFKVYYVWYFLIPLILFLLYYIGIGISSLYIKKPIYKSKFLNDNPISIGTQDRLEYKPYIESLSDILQKESFPKSFSIALVGPWGNGKSSLLNMVEKELDNKLNRKSSLFIHFLPYLNHKEDDIINEFFVLLSNKLAKFSGKLSDQILNYSQKITDLYQNKNLVEFVSKSMKSSESLAAKELYEKINKSLLEINKKIIVFIDDLDRLSGNEIIQVLKLIRNTADFKNTIFVVAMDKNYVLRRLKSSNEILNANYLEKFFQLEIYLPEIDKNTLREYFIESFDDYKLDEASDFNRILKEALTDDNILFDDYVNNLRDVKRYSNQVKFDYPVVKSEIDLTDFINFTFLKTKFPNIINQLYNDRSNLLFYDKAKDIYYLEVSEDKQEQEKGQGKPITADIIKVFLNDSSTIKTKDLNEYSKYKIFQNLSNNEKCKDNINTIDCEDLYLLIKTLHNLFGNMEAKNSKSIQLQDNLNILFQRRIHEHIFTQNDYKSLILFENLEQLKKVIKELNDNKKLPQFLKKLKWFESKDAKELKQIIQILIYLFEVKNDYNLNVLDVDKKLSIYAQEILKKKYGGSDQNSEWLWEKIFDEQFLSIQNQILLLGDLWDSKNDNNLWGFSIEKVSKKAIELYSKYLENIDKNLWEIDDFRFYGYYHSIKNIDNVHDEINKLLITFWSNRDVELLCAQTLQPPAFSFSSYMTSIVLLEIFGDHNAFVEFVQQHKLAKEEAIKEYIDFLILLQKTLFKTPLDFVFEKSELIKMRIKEIQDNYKKNTIYDELEGIAQILFESNDKKLFYSLNAHELKTKYRIQVYEHENYAVLRANINREDAKKQLFELASTINKIAGDNAGWKYDSLDKEKLNTNASFLTHNNDTSKYIKIIHPTPIRF